MIQLFLYFVAFVLCGLVMDWWLKNIYKDFSKQFRKEFGLPEKEEPYKEPFRFRPFGRFSDWWHKNHYWP